MILRKYMSLLGIGAARVDLILENNVFGPGEGVSGHFFIKGGTIEQKIKRIECDLIQKNVVTNIESIIDSVTIFISRLIDSNEDNTMPFSFHLPNDIDVSNTELSYLFKTRLIFDEGMTSVDLDHIQIVE